MTAKAKSRLVTLLLGIAVVLLSACSANGVDSAGGAAASSAKFIVPPPQVSIAISPATLKEGQTAMAVWDTTDDSHCAATGGNPGGDWGGALTLSDEQGYMLGPFTKPGTYNFVITCSGSGGTTSIADTVTVGAQAAPVVTFDLIPPSIQPGNSSLLVWSTQHATTCTGSGGTGVDGWQGAQPTQNAAGFSTGVINTTGGYAYDMTCIGPGGQTQQSRILTVNANAAATPPTMSFAAQSTQVQPGQSIIFTWSTNGASACAASGGSGADAWQGKEPTQSTGTSTGPVNAAGSYAYTLTCTGDGGSVGNTVNVNVTASTQVPTVVVDLSVSPQQPIAVGSAGTLAWSTANATSCAASGSWSGAEPLLGSGVSTGTLTAAGIYSYALTCTGANGASTTGTASLTVVAGIGVVTAFNASPSSIQIGQPTMLSWSSTGASYCTASGGIGTDGWGGQVATSSSGTSVGPFPVPGNYVYALTCTGPGGTSAPSTATVIVSTTSAASIIAFTATPSSLTVGASSSLDWATNGATACTATGGTGSDGWNGSVPTSSNGTSTGTLTVAGNYTYMLTCAGPGGTSPVSSVVVNVNPLVPVGPTISSFTAAPSTIQVGQSSSLEWATSGATSCTATGGTGSDGWNGTQATSSAATSTGVITVAGSYTYTLTCSDGITTGSPASVIVNVTAAPTPAATIGSFAATPSSVPMGGTTSLSWTSTNASYCTASGGTGADAWGGTVAVSSSGTTVGPLPTAGTVTYDLVCTGPGGSSAQSNTLVAVTTPNAAQPTVTLLANNSNPAQIQPGQSASFSWTSTNATSCTASGGTGSDGWSGSMSTSSSGFTVGPIATPGIYSYTLTCTGSGGTGSSSLMMTVISSSSADCGVGTPTTELLAPAAQVSNTIYPICLGCNVVDESYVIDADKTDAATIDVSAGVLGSVSLQVTDSTTFPAGRKVGFIIADGSSLLSLSALQNVSIITSLQSTVQETATSSNLLDLQALGLLSYDPTAGYAEFTTTKPFNAVAINVQGVASVLSTVKVYGACVSLQ